ncbi:conserved hypothetical protein [Tiamatvirus PSSP7]|uniref:Uncharacterized protein n=2 Tax=Prochlorococcus phage P-SSP7 TaxID=268748 RepID=Q58N20_BPPRP|nr:tail fiber protein [Prochlorococcus phage P-SSP7]AAX44218.1 uncharacterized protein PSSP7_039 [Prochlorococcus phage P-SSP7]ACY76241.1 conserved hypothetical protein [Tiamatvirus PSSP7]
MATLNATNLKHASSSSNNIVLAADGSVSMPNSSFGKILQVKQAVKTDTASSNTATFADLSGLSVSITPASSSNKILVSCALHVSSQQNSFQGFKVLRDSTAIGLGTAATGNMSNVSFATMAVNTGSAAYGLRSANFEFLDSPNSTSAITYKIQWASLYQSYTSYINRPYSTTNEAFNSHASSSITLYEVAA